MSASSVSYAVWGLILTGALVLWWVSMSHPSTVARLSDVVARLATHPVIRVVLVLGFMWLGWHLFAR